MEPNLENVSNEIVSASTPAATPAPEKPKSSKTPVLVAFFFAILAIAGIAGAIYFFMDANNKAIANAELQTKLDLIKTETGTEIVEKEENGTTVTVVETTVDPNDYIYIGEYGIKIKKPENWSDSVKEYTYLNYPAQDSFVISLAPDDTILPRISITKTDECGDLILPDIACFEIEGNYFRVSEQIKGSTEDPNGYTLDEGIKSHFTDKDNYSKI